VILTKKVVGAGVTPTSTSADATITAAAPSHQITGTAAAGTSPWAATTNGTTTVILTAASKVNQSTTVSGSADNGGSFAMARSTYGCPVGGASPWIASRDGTANVVMTAATRGPLSIAWSWSVTGTGTLTQVHDVTGVAAPVAPPWVCTHPASLVVATFHSTGAVPAGDSLTFALAGSGTITVVIFPVGAGGDVASVTIAGSTGSPYTYTTQSGDDTAAIATGLESALVAAGWSAVADGSVITITGPGPGLADFAAFTPTDSSILQPGSSLALTWAVTTPAIAPLPANPSPKIGGFGAGSLVCDLAGLTRYKVDLWGFFAATGTWAAISSFATATITQPTTIDVDLTPYNSVYAYVHDFVGSGTATVYAEAI
jgi:hypothetical protein